MESRRRALTQIVAVVVLTLALVYMAKLVSLGIAGQRARTAETHLSSEVEELRSSADALETAVVDAESDEFVERWAREDRKWVREGDHPVAPVPVTDTTRSADQTPSEDEGAWERFKRWLEGE
jgi:hypothetical protein